ncbi:hypothetical protein HDV57DRAFT_382777 [Trichoderma longibrachiatum]
MLMSSSWPCSVVRKWLSGRVLPRPLSFAVQNSDQEAVEYFMAQCAPGPDVSCRGCDGATSLHVAANGLKGRIVQLLITKWEVSVNATDDYQGKSLHVVANAHIDASAVEMRKRIIIESLLRAGAHTSATDINGHAPRDLFFLFFFRRRRL